MPQSIMFDLDRAFILDNDVLDLHFAVLEAVVKFLDDYECKDSTKLSAAIRVSFNLVCQRYQSPAE